MTAMVRQLLLYDKRHSFPCLLCIATSVIFCSHDGIAPTEESNPAPLVVIRLDRSEALEERRWAKALTGGGMLILALSTSEEEIPAFIVLDFRFDGGDAAERR